MAVPRGVTFFSPARARKSPTSECVRLSNLRWWHRLRPVSNECLIESTAEKRTRARAQRNMNLLRLATTLCLLSCALAAQWPAHKTPTPDLSATAPRSADGKPDLSGVWMIQNSGSLFYIHGNVTPAEMLPWAAALLKQREQNFRRDTDGINWPTP